MEAREDSYIQERLLGTWEDGWIQERLLGAKGDGWIQETLLGAGGGWLDTGNAFESKGRIVGHRKDSWELGRIFG